MEAGRPEGHPVGAAFGALPVGPAAATDAAVAGATGRGLLDEPKRTLADVTAAAVMHGARTQRSQPCCIHLWQVEGGS